MASCWAWVAGFGGGVGVDLVFALLFGGDVEDEVGLGWVLDLVLGEDLVREAWERDWDCEGVYMRSENGILRFGEEEGGNLRCAGREGGVMER